MNKNEFIESLKDQIVHYLECRAVSLEKKEQETAYSFWVMAKTTLEHLDMFIQQCRKDEKE